MQLGALFFIAAATYLTIIQELSLISFMAILGCSICAALTIKKPQWAVILGAGLISSSFAMQSIFGYCSTCFKASLFILCGIVFISIFEKGAIKALVITMSVLFMAGFTFSNIHTDSQIRQYYIVQDGEEEILINTQEKYILFFSTTCPACKNAVKALSEVDPEGQTWVPVQIDNNYSESYLREHGYIGKYYYYGNTMPVPAFVSTHKGKAYVIYNPESMKNKALEVLKNANNN